MEEKTKEIQQDERSLRILHYSFQFGDLVIFAALFFTFVGEKYLSIDLEMFLMIGFFLAVINVVASRVLFKQKMAEVNTKPEAERIQLIRAAYILKWALLQGAFLVNVMFFYFSGNKAHLFIALFVWVLLAYDRPKLSQKDAFIS